MYWSGEWSKSQLQFLYSTCDSKPRLGYVEMIVFKQNDTNIKQIIVARNMTIKTISWREEHTEIIDLNATKQHKTHTLQSNLQWKAGHKN